MDASQAFAIESWFWLPTYCAVAVSITDFKSSFPRNPAYLHEISGERIFIHNGSFSKNGSVHNARPYPVYSSVAFR